MKIGTVALLLRYNIEASGHLEGSEHVFELLALPAFTRSAACREPHVFAAAAMSSSL
jgi:hypothetical protein